MSRATSLPIPPIARQARSRRQARPRIDGVTWAPYFFLAPFALLFFTFLIGPMAYAAYLSVFRHTLMFGDHFVGIANYLHGFSDPELWHGIVTILQFGAIMIPVLILLALGAALILDSGLVAAASFFRITIFLPYAIPGVVATLLWGYLYGPNYGLITQTLRFLGFAPPDLLSRGTIIASLVNISVWQYLGYNFIIFYAALKAVPSELFEAAAMDGTRGLQAIWHIKLPLIRGATVTVLLFAIIGTMQLFNEPFLLRPAARDVVNSSFTPNIYAYTLAFRNQQYNYASAVSFMIAAATAIISLIFLTIVNRRGRNG